MVRHLLSAPVMSFRVFCIDNSKIAMLYSSRKGERAAHLLSLSDKDAVDGIKVYNRNKGQKRGIRQAKSQSH